MRQKDGNKMLEIMEQLEMFTAAFPILEVRKLKDGLP